jgi:ethanolamine utilization protein EutN
MAVHRVRQSASGGGDVRLAKVVGQVVATVKASGLGSFKLLIVQDAVGASPSRTSGPVYVAVDLVGAGEGELVLVVSGSGARVCTESAAAPVDTAVVAIADSVIRNGDVTYRKS